MGGWGTEAHQERGIPRAIGRQGGSILLPSICRADQPMKHRRRRKPHSDRPGKPPILAFPGNAQFRKPGRQSWTFASPGGCFPHLSTASAGRWSFATLALLLVAIPDHALTETVALEALRVPLAGMIEIAGLPQAGTKFGPVVMTFPGAAGYARLVTIGPSGGTSFSAAANSLFIEAGELLSGGINGIRVHAGRVVIKAARTAGQPTVAVLSNMSLGAKPGSSLEQLLGAHGWPHSLASADRVFIRAFWRGESGWGGSAGLAGERPVAIRGARQILIGAQGVRISPAMLEWLPAKGTGVPWIEASLSSDLTVRLEEQGKGTGLSAKALIKLNGVPVLRLSFGLMRSRDGDGHSRLSGVVTVGAGSISAGADGDVGAHEKDARRLAMWFAAGRGTGANKIAPVAAVIDAAAEFARTGTVASASFQLPAS